MKILIFAFYCAVILGATSAEHEIQKRQTTGLPNYTKLSVEEILHLQNRGFGPTVPTPFKTTAALEESEEESSQDVAEDISQAQSQQQRRPHYQEQPYVQNVIPVYRTGRPPIQQVQRVQGSDYQAIERYQAQQAQARQAQQDQARAAQAQARQEQLAQQARQAQLAQQRAKAQEQQTRLANQQIYRKNPQNYEKQSNPHQNKLDDEEKEEDEEVEEPDRLTLLLAETKFECVSKKTGYYADEQLGCEVFHYCQDGARHSWICPEGFTFHQVHLICMPPGSDNICEQSSKYHFVNEYLYKPLNLEEHQAKPNISLRYSDRYYPEPYNHYETRDDDEAESKQYHHQKKPIQVGFQQGQAINKYVVANQGQVFRSPEEVNISLQQRRPQYQTQRYREE